MYRSTAILSANSNFVKRVVFPLEILPTSAVLSSLILNLFSVIVLIGALIWFGYPIGWNLLLMPVVLLPLVMLTQGLSYIVTTLGVYFRDLGQAMGIIMNVLFYLSPVFYPITAVPERFQSYMHFNPLTSLIESFRAVTINNAQPDWGQLSIIYIVSFGVFLLGAYIFKISKETFSDVI
jgi:lipopolysaccharide transport system permease protein